MPYPGIHILSDINQTLRKAICRNCGPIGIHRTGSTKSGKPKWRCKGKARQTSRYKLSQREYSREYSREYARKRRQCDLNFRIAANLRTRLCLALRDGWKSGSAVSDLGCSIEELRVYLQTRFCTGMSWENWGEWHIDHIEPLSSFDLTDKEQFLKAAHYSNLQPLWKLDNLRKGGTKPKY